jgi:hypothetical protein
MARNKLTDEQWAEIRRVWEYDPAEPTYLVAGTKAAEKFGFTGPSKSTIDDRAKREGWERKASMTGINAAAQRKADRMGVPDGPDAAPDGQPDASGGKKSPPPPSSPSDPASAASARDEAEDLRAAVLARHREEWKQVAGLRQEALFRRPKPINGQVPPGQMDKVKDAFDAMKLAKITAEATAIQQQGERKAWGLDVVIDPDQMRTMSDEDLAALAAGKAPRRG